TIFGGVGLTREAEQLERGALRGFPLGAERAARDVAEELARVEALRAHGRTVRQAHERFDRIVGSKCAGFQLCAHGDTLTQVDATVASWRTTRRWPAASAMPSSEPRA